MLLDLPHGGLQPIPDHYPAAAGREGGGIESLGVQGVKGRPVWAEAIKAFTSSGWGWEKREAILKPIGSRVQKR